MTECSSCHATAGRPHTEYCPDRYRGEPVTEYQRLYRRAEVRERWANIYGGKTTHGEFMRLWATQDRLSAEVIKGFRVEALAAWIGRQLTKETR